MEAEEPLGRERTEHDLKPASTGEHAVRWAKRYPRHDACAWFAAQAGVESPQRGRKRAKPDDHEAIRSCPVFRVPFR